MRARDLSRLQHDGLRDSLLIAKRFKERISYHFRLRRLLSGDWKCLSSCIARSRPTAWARRRLRDLSYEFLFEQEHPTEVVVFDTETTGLDRKRSDIISLAAIRISGSRLLVSQRWSWWCAPPGAIEHAAIAGARIAPYGCCGWPAGT